MLVKFSSYKLTAKKHLQIIAVRPSGEETKLFKEPVPVFFQADELGANVRVEATMGLKSEGVYWFKAYLDDEFMGECPLRLILQKQQSAMDERKK